jgi:MHS family proline/betaine transporter-like MFS transporter
MAVVYVALRMMLVGAPKEFMVGQCLLGVPLGMALGLQGAMAVEIFPLRTRVTSMSLAYSVTLMLSGGIAPFVATWLIDLLGQPMAPAYYTMGYGVIGLALMSSMKETNHRALDDSDLPLPIR